MEGSGFRDQHAEFEKKNAVILGASFDGPEANARFAEKYAFPFPLLSATPEMGVAYGAADDSAAKHARRVSVIVDPDGKVLRYWPKVSPKDFPGEALAAIPG